MHLAILLFFGAASNCVQIAHDPAATGPADCIHTAEVTGTQAERLNHRMAWLTVSNGVVLDAGEPVPEPMPRRAAYRALLGTNTYGQLRLTYRATINAAGASDTTATRKAAFDAMLRLDRLSQARLAMQLERLQAGVKPEDEDP